MGIGVNLGGSLKGALIASHDTHLTASRIPLIGLLVVQMLLGYEWLMSGLTKIVRGAFPSGLADDLRDKSQGAPGWYRSFLDGGVIPHASVFGYAIEISELLVGLALVVAALVWLLRWERLPEAGRLVILATTTIASLAAIFMAVNFHLANGAPHPWFIAKDGFDEGIDLDSLLPAIQPVLIGVSVAIWRVERRATRPDQERGRIPSLERSLT
jgi:thiosulfate dehydrogenase [quinone] large subunit